MAGTLNKGSLVKSSGGGNGGGGGGSAFPTVVTDSGSSLPATSGFSYNDTFLNTTDKKIYKTEVNGYIANNGTTITNIDIDYTTGIANFVALQSFSCSRTISWSENWNNSGSATKTYSCKFKISSLNTNKPIFRLTSSNSGIPGSDSAAFAVKTDNKIHHIRYESYYTSTILSDVAILDTPLEVDTIYVLNIQKTGTDCVAQLTLEDGTIVEEKTFTTTNISSSYPSSVISYGSSYVDGSYPATNNLTVYLPDSYGDLLIPNTSTLSWDTGTDLTDKTEYADKTNGALYLYENSELVKIPQNKIFTDVYANSWVEDSTYADYGYKCEITNLNGVTSNMFAQVIFAPAQADSGNYATVCLTGNGKVTIYSKVNDTISIPSIVVMGV